MKTNSRSHVSVHSHCWISWLPKNCITLIRLIFRGQWWLYADHSGCAVYGVSLQQLDCWNCESEARRGHGCSPLVFVVCSVGSSLCDIMVTSCACARLYWGCLDRIGLFITKKERTLRNPSDVTNMKFRVLPTQFICMFRIVVAININYVLNQSQLIGLCNGNGLCSLSSRNWFLYV